jgi:hypothetical protein
MGEIEVILTCPLGSQCEEIKDNKLYRCRWFMQIAGINPNTGDKVDERKCSIGEWMPILMIENSMQQRSTSAAVESFRNEVVKKQEFLLQDQKDPLIAIQSD